jgi:hypothetical protein
MSLKVKQKCVSTIILVFQHLLVGLLGNGGLEDALTNSLGYKGVVDHLGNKWETINETIEHYGIPPRTYRHRVESGWSLKDILTIPVRKGWASSVKCKDHLGNEFSSILEMCEYYSINHQAFRHRIKRGWNIEKALTTKNRRGNSKVKSVRCHRSEEWKVGKGFKVKDHKGKEFDSLRKMAEYYGLTPSILYNRLHTGWDLERALTEKIHK